MHSRGFWLFAVALTCGSLIGAGVAAEGLAAHQVCSVGAVIGYSGTLATVQWLAVAPPGGYANLTEWNQITTRINGGTTSTFGEGFTGFTNGSVAALYTFNWTMNAVTLAWAPGFGAAASCPAYSLTPTAPSSGPWERCVGCWTTPQVPAGVGDRVVLPSNFSVDGIPSSEFNASYAAQPIGSFGWSFSNGTLVGPWSSGSLDGSGLGWTNNLQWYDSIEYLPLTFSVPPSQMGIGIPIHLSAGGEVVAPVSVGAVLPGWTSWFNVTYDFPVSTDQGTWDVYQAAPGSPESIGGMLFEQTAV